MRETHEDCLCLYRECVELEELGKVLAEEELTDMATFSYAESVDRVLSWNVEAIRREAEKEEGK